MARIRSIHPGLFTDEAFVSCGPLARLLVIGLWTEADDQGVFEWKPVTLKMRLLPVDNADVVALLEELAEFNMIRRFQCEGRSYGAIRNFRKFQRPKSPNATHPLPTDFRKYVGLAGDGTEPAPPHEEPVPQIGEIERGEAHPFPQSGEKSPQMEDGGGRKEEDSEAVASDASASPAEPPTVAEQVWRTVLPWLAEHSGKKEASLRSVVGRWCRDHGEPAVLGAFMEAARSPPVEPIAWFTRRLGGAGNGRNSGYGKRVGPATVAVDAILGTQYGEAGE